MSERKKKQNHGDENIVKLHIADHPVRLSFAAEPDPQLPSVSVTA